MITQADLKAEASRRWRKARQRKCSTNKKPTLTKRERKELPRAPYRKGTTKEGYFNNHPEACVAKPRDPLLPRVRGMRTRTVRRLVKAGKINALKPKPVERPRDDSRSL